MYKREGDEKFKILVLIKALNISAFKIKNLFKTILKHFDKGATLLISTHMIADIEQILDEVIMIDNGEIVLHENANKLRKKEKATIDEIFRRKFYVL